MRRANPDALEDHIDILGGATVHMSSVNPVGDQSARLGKLSASVHDGQPCRYGALSHLPTSTHQQCIFQREDTSCSSLRGGFDAGQDLIGACCFEHLDRLFRRDSRRLELPQCQRRERRIRIHQHCDGPFTWEEIVEEL